jgi:alanyl-tRNA synthetase
LTKWLLKHQEEVSEQKFELYDTFSFSKDLTALILKKKGYTYNETDFEVELQNKSAFSCRI